MTWHGGQSLSGSEGEGVTRRIGRHLDRPHRVHGVDVQQRIYKNLEVIRDAGGVATMGASAGPGQGRPRVALPAVPATRGRH